MKTFYAVVFNTLVATVSATLVWFALSIWIYLQTRSVLVTSILAASYTIALIISGVFFGSLVDHNLKKRIIIVSDVLAIVFSAIGFLIYIFTPAKELTNPLSFSLWIFVLPVFLGVIVSNLRSIVVPTLTTILVPEENRDRANGFSGSLTGVAYLVAPIMGGFLIALSGMFWILILGIGLRVATLIHILFVKISEKLEVHEEKRSNFDFKGTLAIVRSIPGLMALLIFNSLNNFLGGVFMPLFDPYGLSLMSQQAWGVLSGVLSLGFILGGAWIARKGLGKSPLKSLFVANIFIWSLCIFFTIQPSIILLAVGVFLFFAAIPFIEASEQTVIQKVVPKANQGRVFGFAQSVEAAASPVSTLAIGPVAQFIFIPFMTVGVGAEILGPWFGVGDGRGIALLFTVTGILGLLFTIFAMRTHSYRILTAAYEKK